MMDYFTFDGQLSSNRQREGVYAKLLSESLVESYMKHNVVLSSHVVAFVTFHMIFQDYKSEGLMHLVNLKSHTFDIEMDEMIKLTYSIIQHLHDLNKQEKLLLSDEPWENTEKLIEVGLSNLGIYHAVDILKYTKDKNLVCKNIRLLYFYHNRMVNYGLEELMGWEKAWIN